MKTFAKILLFVSIISLISCTKDDVFEPGPKTFASADIYSISTTDGELYTQGELTGNMTMVYQDGVTSTTITLFNMEPNTIHAMHIHQGSLENPGRHWNQNIFTSFCNEKSLGEVWAKPAAGDVGNIEIDEEGNGTFTLQTDLWTLNQELDSDIENNVLFIHQMEENFAEECDPNHQHQHGHTNAKIAGGVIGLLPVEEI